MDSPLLPTLRHRPDITSSPTNLLSDLSLSDADHSPSHADSYLPSASSSRTHASAASYSHQHPLNGYEEDHDDTVEAIETPQKPTSKSKPRFSLFAPSQPAAGGASSSLRGSQAGVDEGHGGYDEGDETIHDGGVVPEADARARGPGPTTQERDDKLRESLYELRGMNEVFEGFLQALEGARGHNERLRDRVRQTTELLDQYTALLGQTEHTQTLLSNPNWTGAEDDAQALYQEEEARLQAEREAAEEARRADEMKRAADEERERQRAAKEAPATRGGAGGAGRGRGAPRGGTIRGGRGGSVGQGRPSVAPGQSGIRPPTTTAVRKTSASAGLNGQYANVKSSGYGPRKAA